MRRRDCCGQTNDEHHCSLPPALGELPDTEMCLRGDAEIGHAAQWHVTLQECIGKRVQKTGRMTSYNGAHWKKGDAEQIQHTTGVFCCRYYMEFDSFTVPRWCCESARPNLCQWFACIANAPRQKICICATRPLM